MKNLVIIGARGFGRELYSLAVQCKEYNTEWRIKGFLDDKADALDDFDGYPSILGPVETYEIHEDDVFICALGDVEYKKKYSEIILVKGGVFTNIIHPSALIYHGAKLGYGVVVCPFVIVSSNVSVGNFVLVQSHVGIGHDVVVGDWAIINAFSFLGGFVKVMEGAFLGAGCKIVPRKTIGEYATVGIGSVVTKNVKSNTTVFGIPAKQIF